MTLGLLSVVETQATQYWGRYNARTGRCLIVRMILSVVGQRTFAICVIWLNVDGVGAMSAQVTDLAVTALRSVGPVINDSFVGVCLAPFSASDCRYIFIQTTTARTFS